MKAKARRRGRLVVLEGIDGVGKSTLARALARSLRRRGFSVALRREPADPRLGLLAQHVSPEDPWSGAVYFTVDRYVARPALERALAHHDFVVSDRSYFSTLAYQGSALPPRERHRLRALSAAATRAPDRILLLDLPPREALGRLGVRGRTRGPLEKLRVLDRVARAYRELARHEKGWTVLDARRPPAELVSAAVGVLRASRGPSFRRRSGERR